MTKRLFLIFLLLILVTMACSLGGTAPRGDAPPQEGQQTTPSRAAPTGEVSASPQGEDAIPPIYVTVAGHIEDVSVYANCDAYPDFRGKLLQFAEAIAPYNAAVNLQIEYEFFMGVSRCETGEMKAATNGQNVIDYLATRYHFEIDAHQEGGWDVEGRDNYADIRYLGGQVTSAITETLGGLVWDDPAQWMRLAGGESGQIYPDFTWTPEAFTLAVSSKHHEGDFSDDDVASGVWIPKGARSDFWTHDPNGPMVYIGPGEYDNWSANPTHLPTSEFVQYLLAQLEQGRLPRDKMYTASIAVPQSIIFHPEEYGDLLAVLDQLKPLVESGQVVYATYAQVVEIWRTEYGASPNIFLR
ncbi:MAG: hypothetical protein GXP40_00710 [Chloroflexi bacterium]|nr:hypothetical protein [Chloroflexota bacterium]